MRTVHEALVAHAAHPMRSPLGRVCLPEDVTWHILTTFLGLSDLSSLRATCRSFFEFTESLVVSRCMCWNILHLPATPWLGSAWCQLFRDTFACRACGVRTRYDQLSCDRCRVVRHGRCCDHCLTKVHPVRQSVRPVSAYLSGGGDVSHDVSHDVSLRPPQYLRHLRYVCEEHDVFIVY